MKVPLLITLIATFFYAPSLLAEKERQLPWSTQYEQSVAVAKRDKKPLVLFFTGSDWCGWCKKLEQEVFTDPKFIDHTKDQFVFVKLDFPMRTPQTEEIEVQNTLLQEKYAVRTFPTIVILSAQGEQIGITGYRPGGGEAYKQHLLGFYYRFEEYKNKFNRLNREIFTGKELKRLYQEAREFNRDQEAYTIIERGTHSDLAHFFLTERYKSLAGVGKESTIQAQLMRDELLKSDQKLIHYQVAVIDFERYCAEVEQGKCSLENAAAPLHNYIETFGSKDKENLWRLYLALSELYSDNKKPGVALEYAKKSLQVSPHSIRDDIASAIKNLELELSYR